MNNPEYMKIPLKVIPPDNQEQYDIENFITISQCTSKLKKGMYGLQQTAMFEYKKIVTHLGS